MRSTDSTATDQKKSAESNLMTEREVAEILGICHRTLQGWRCKGTGPLFVRVGRRVRYEPAALQAWLRENRRRSTSDSGPLDREPAEISAR